MYMFLGLAIICDDYFVASLEQIVEVISSVQIIIHLDHQITAQDLYRHFSSLQRLIIAAAFEPDCPLEC